MQSPESIQANSFTETLARTYKFGYKVKRKAKQNEELREQIKRYLYDTAKIELPSYKQDFKANQERVFNYDSECESRWLLLANLYYSLGSSKGYYALFQNEKEEKVVPLAFWYSRHRLDFVWNWRKSQIIRSRYRNFLQTATDEQNRLLINHYQPIHLVLTVPHADGKFKGKRFYVSELIKLYHELRRTEPFKKYIYAGEYGVEIKRSRKHGLHIHIHSFILQRPEFSTNEVRNSLTKEWKRLTGNETNFSGLHYETLYVREKSANGEYTKNYIQPKTATIETYLSGVMECIKYHFKQGCLEQENGEYDILLIDEILHNTKGVRLYSRFGNFYKEKSLNFNNLETESVTVVDEETGEVIEEIQTDASRSEANLINPFTLKPAEKQEYQIVISSTANVKHKNKLAAIPYETYLLNSAKFVVAPNELSLKEVIKYDIQHKLNAFVESYQFQT